MTGDRKVHRRAVAFAALALGLAAGVGAQAQENPVNPMLAAMLNAQLTVKPLRGGAYWVAGGVSNTGFVVGDTGVVAIDPQMFAPVAKREQAEIAKITPKPVNVMILTHADPDHVNGLAGWPQGIQVIAHENAAAEMKAYLQDTNPTDSPPPPEVKDYLPKRTIRFTEDTVLDGVKVRLIHVGAAHTDGDIAIYLPDQKVVFAGDWIVADFGNFPAIHVTGSGPLTAPHMGAFNKHGSSLGWIKSMRAILALDADLYVPGHGEMLSKAELQKRLDLTIERRAQIKAMYDKGMTLDQIKATFNDPPLTGASAMFPTFTETTYSELGME